jgi:hypothetical protein
MSETRRLSCASKLGRGHREASYSPARKMGASTGGARRGTAPADLTKAPSGGEHLGLGESLASVARRKTAANGPFRCISSPSLCDALLNLRLGDTLKSETGSTISETRFEASHQYAARGVLQCRNAEEPSGRRVDVDRRSGNFATIPMEISFEEKCQFTTARVDRLMALRGFHRIGRSSALTRS